MAVIQENRPRGRLSFGVGGPYHQVGPSINVGAVRPNAFADVKRKDSAMRDGGLFALLQSSFSHLASIAYFASNAISVGVLSLLRDLDSVWNDGSVFWSEKLEDFVDTLQIFGVIWFMQRNWDCPSLWLEWSFFPVVFNLDVVGIHTYELVRPGNKRLAKVAEVGEWPQGLSPSFPYFAYAIVFSIIIAAPWLAYAWVYYRTRRELKLDLSHLARLRAWLLTLTSFLYLPTCLVVLRLFSCTGIGYNICGAEGCTPSETSLLMVDQNVQCFSGGHVTAAVIVGCVGLCYMLAYPLLLLYYHRLAVVHVDEQEHERYLLRKQLEYKLGLNMDWKVLNIYLVAPFRRGHSRHRCFRALLKLLIASSYVFLTPAIVSGETQALLILGLLSVWATLNSWSQVYRCYSSHLVAITNQWMLVSYVFLGWQKSSGAQNAFTLDSTVAIAMLSIAGVHLLLQIIIIISTCAPGADHGALELLSERIRDGNDSGTRNVFAERYRQWTAGTDIDRATASRIEARLFFRGLRIGEPSAPTESAGTAAYVWHMFKVLARVSEVRVIPSEVFESASEESMFGDVTKTGKKNKKKDNARTRMLEKVNKARAKEAKGILPVDTVNVVDLVNSLRRSLKLACTTRRTAGELAEIDEIFDHMTLLRTCVVLVSSSEECAAQGHVLLDTLMEVLQDLAALYMIHRDSSFRPHPALTDANLRQLRDMVDRRAEETRLMRPVKARILFRLLCLRAFIGDRNVSSISSATHKAQLRKHETCVSLLVCAKKGDLSGFRAAIEGGSSIEGFSVDSYLDEMLGWSALHYAASMGGGNGSADGWGGGGGGGGEDIAIELSSMMTRLLLAFGANVNLAAFNGDTPAHAAAEAGNVSTLKLLLAAGANGNAENARGETPADMAAEGDGVGDWAGCLRVLKEWADGQEEKNAQG